MRTVLKNITHYFDIWHLKKSMNKHKVPMLFQLSLQKKICCFFILIQVHIPTFKLNSDSKFKKKNNTGLDLVD